MIVTLATNSNADPAADLSSALPMLMIVMGVVIMAAMFMIWTRKRMTDRNSTPSPARQIFEQHRQSSGLSMRGDVDAARADLLDTAQRLSAQLDNKAERIEQLLAQTDQRISDLQRIVDAVKERPAETSPQSSVTANPAPSVNPAPESSSSPPPPPPSVRLDPLTRSIYRLADQGKSVVDIARELDEQTGKVELILALRPSATSV